MQAMNFSPEPAAPPLREDAQGALRVGNSRVLAELVLRAFQDGATPETIVQRFPTLELADVYAVIGYYLRNSAELDMYLRQRERAAAEMLARNEHEQEALREIRTRLLLRAGGDR
jgi:uncharacterized protein (DUF433 family)